MADLTKLICQKLIDTHRAYGWRAEKEALFSPRRIDVLAIAPGAIEVIGYEIKTSLQDFRNELKNPEKRQAVARHCTSFYFAVPIEMILPKDVPSDCGLLYFEDGWIYVAKAAPTRSSESVFEVEIREFWEGKARREEEQQIEMEESQRRDEKDSREQGLIWESDGLDSAIQLPHWMLPRFYRPMLFQLDVRAVAAKMAAAVLPAMEFDFDEVPF